MKKWLLLWMILAACEIEPEPINYGLDQCHYCSMTIVDKQHSAEYVTEKGKSFKFDAIECLFNDLRASGITPAMILVSTLDQSGLKMAEEVHFLISEEIPSPMGANLSAVSDTTYLQETPRNSPYFPWEQMKEHLK